MNTQRIAYIASPQYNTVSLAPFAHAQRAIDTLLAKTFESGTPLLPEHAYSADDALNLDGQEGIAYDENAAMSIRIFHPKRSRQTTPRYSTEMQAIAKEVMVSCSILAGTCGRAMAQALLCANEYLTRQMVASSKVLPIMDTVEVASPLLVKDITHKPVHGVQESIDDVLVVHSVASPVVFENMLWNMPPVSCDEVHVLELTTLPTEVPEASVKRHDIYEAVRIVTARLLGKSLTSK